MSPSRHKQMNDAGALPRGRPPRRHRICFSMGTINAISGATAGLFAGVVVCPLDVIKTKLQVQGSFRQPGERALYKGIIGTMKTIVHEDGVKGLYRGITPMVVGYLPTWAIYFFVYGKMQALTKDQPFHTVISAVTAGATSTIATNPIWVIKTRLMAQGKHTSWQYRGMVDAVRTMMREEGLRSFYSGLGPALLGLPHVAIQFPIYEWLKIRMCGEGTSETQKTLGYLAASILSKITASTITYPHEVIRSRNQIKSAVGDTRYRGLVRTVRTLLHQEGWRVFYAGLFTNICRAGPASAVTLVTYELVSSFLRDHYLCPGEP